MPGKPETVTHEPRNRGFMGVLSLSSAAMINAGVFLLPGLALCEVGSDVLFALALTALLTLPAVFAKLELTSAIPRKGGSFFYLSRILGNLSGFVAGLSDWYAASFRAAFALAGLGLYARMLLPGLEQWVFQAGVGVACLSLGALNLFPHRWMRYVQLTLLVAVCAVFAWLVAAGAGNTVALARNALASFADPAGTIGNLRGILAAAGMSFVMYGGVSRMSFASHRSRSPRGRMLKWILAIFILVQVLYYFTMLVAAGSSSGVPPQPPGGESGVFAASCGAASSPAASFPGAVAAISPAGVFSWISLFLGIGIFLAVALESMFLAGRACFAMASEGFLPGFLTRGKRRKCPSTAATALTCALAGCAGVFLDIAFIAKVSSACMMLVFMMENAAVLVIRYSRIGNYRPLFRAPLFPVLQGLGVMAFGLLLFFLGGDVLLSLAALLLPFAGVYALFFARMRRRGSALIRLIRTNAERDFGDEDGDLERELMEILIERDNIREDRFTSIIKDAMVLDYDRVVDRRRVFADCAWMLAGRWKIPAAKFENAFEEREKLTPTLLTPEVAVPHAMPHAIVEGGGVFDIMLVRNRHGIKWNDEGDVVYSAFCLIGSKDEREFHLKALMYLAQVLRDPAFFGSWNAAINESGLRAAIILAKRKR